MSATAHYDHPLPARRPTLVLLATGGTIAGVANDQDDPRAYVAGALPAEALLAAAPGIGEVAEIRPIQSLNMDSKDMTPAHWLRIARDAQEALAPVEVDGLMITHGTDTMEETALFLALVLNTRKPVVLTGAMRPATAVSADGPANLLDAARVAAHKDSRGRGVVVSFAESIFPAMRVRKHHGDKLDAFTACDGPIGTTRPAVRYFRPPQPGERTVPIPDEVKTLPQVEILHVGAGSSPTQAEAAASHGARGIVLALPGNGSLPAYWTQTIARLSANGICVVRASRCAEGFVTARAEDRETGAGPAGALSPAGARVALMLGLATKARQRDFDMARFFRDVAGLSAV